MITEQNTTPAATDPTPNYEYLQVQATVNNFTGQAMIITGSDLSWGKWMASPVDVPSLDSISFSSQGRDSSPSGTEGWATWTIGSAVIKVTFSCPYIGSNDQSISCSEGNYVVSCTGTGGNVNNIIYKIRPP